MGDVNRRLNMKRSSKSGTDSNAVAAELDSMKKFAEDDDIAGVVGLILGNSSKSIARADLGSHESSRKSQRGTIQNTIKFEDPYASNPQYNTGRQMGERRGSSLDREAMLQDKYSPVFSSVNRRELNQNAIGSNN